MLLKFGASVDQYINDLNYSFTKNCENAPKQNHDLSRIAVLFTYIHCIFSSVYFFQLKNYLTDLDVISITSSKVRVFYVRILEISE